MNKALMIARREFVHNLTRGGFLFAAFGVPLIVVILLFVVFAVISDTQDNTERIGAVGFVDQSGVLMDAVSVPQDFAAYQTVEAARAALDSDAIGAYFVVPADYLEAGEVQIVSDGSVPQALRDQFDAFLIANLGRDLQPAQIDRLIEPINNTILTLDNGRRLESEAVVGLFFAPFIFVFVFLIGSQTTSSYLMSSIVEEKSSRIMEILVTTVTPIQLLFGKILGLGALGLVQLAVWVAGGLIALNLGQGIPALRGVTIPPDLIGVGLVYFMLGYFLLSSIFAGVGAVTNTEQESRQIAGIFSLLFSIPFFFIVQLITDPDGPLMTFLTLFPFTAPITVMMRLGFGSVPTEQLILSIVILLLTTLVVVWASARVFRWALLLYGKRPNLMQILSAIRRAPTMATTASAPVENAPTKG
jgi:ABC-2 type transport system permease protein